MVLSHRGWDRLFARDPAILGRRLLVNGVTFEIVGVMPEGFRGLAVRSRRLLGAALDARQVRPFHRGREADVGLDIIGRLKPGLSREAAPAGLAVWDASQPATAAPIERSRLAHHARPEATVPSRSPLKRCPWSRPCSLRSASSC